MLAYIFWHRPGEDTATDAYERALLTFHRSLAHAPPVGTLGSVSFRVPQAPWHDAPAGDRGEGERIYEDWYLVEDFAALGVLNEAAVGRGHRTAHDGAARRLAGGAGGLYALLEGDRAKLAGTWGALGECSLAVWVARAARSRAHELGELLGDGMDPQRASLWQRQLVLGPAPEFCLLTCEQPAGAAATRLPEGWTARALAREPLRA